MTAYSYEEQHSPRFDASHPVDAHPKVGSQLYYRLTTGNLQRNIWVTSSVTTVELGNFSIY